MVESELTRFGPSSHSELEGGDAIRLREPAAGRCLQSCSLDDSNVHIGPHRFEPVRLNTSVSPISRHFVFIPPSSSRQLLMTTRLPYNLLRAVIVVLHG